MNLPPASYPLALLTACLAFALADVPSAAAVSATSAAAPVEATGTITGRVQNVATAQYLNKARVSLKGSNQVVYTDNFGFFTLLNVPAGPVVLEVFYTDLDVAQIPLTVPPGGTIDQPVDLTSVVRYGQTTGTVKLDAFLVSSDRETDAQAIATNEQRSAANIKNVVSSDSFGDVTATASGVHRSTCRHHRRLRLCGRRRHLRARYSRTRRPYVEGAPDEHLGHRHPRVDIRSRRSTTFPRRGDQGSHALDAGRLAGGRREHGEQERI